MKSIKSNKFVSEVITAQETFVKPVEQPLEKQSIIQKQF
jgi:hypothetical protein